MADGDLGQTLVVNSHDEVRDLVEALNRMTANLRATAEVAEAIAGGNLTVTAKRRSDADLLGIALERMVESCATLYPKPRLRRTTSRRAASSCRPAPGSFRRVLPSRRRPPKRLVLDGADGRQREAERRQRSADREDRAPVGEGRRSQR